MLSIFSRMLVPWLWLLFALFCFRVVAQFLQWKFSLDLLPPFSAWQSGALPYHVLLVSQVLIIVVMFRVCIAFSQGRVNANHKLGIILLVIGVIYFLVMLIRLLLGLFVLPEHFWFGRILPSIFHLVLASFIVLIGYFHFGKARPTI